MAMIVRISLYLLILGSTKGLPVKDDSKNEVLDKKCLDLPPYNSTYPFTKPIKTSCFTAWRIAIISDRDRASKLKDENNTFINNWESRYKTGYLIVNTKYDKALVHWDKSETDKLIKYDLSQKGRGMELSELVVYNGKLYTCDDRTGMVYEIVNGGESVLPFVHLNDGDGTKNKGYKCEWMTVKDNLLWIGSTGKDWSTPQGVFMNHDPEFIKVVDRLGVIQHVNWTDNYLSLRIKTGHPPPGYFFHESAVWSNVLNKWFFLPRKASKVIYDDDLDEKRCTNLLLTTDDKFSDVSVKKVGSFNESRGFSSFKFIPNSKDAYFVALKSVEIGRAVESYVGVYGTDGKVLLDETLISLEKFEGIEFI